MFKIGETHAKEWWLCSRSRHANERLLCILRLCSAHYLPSKPFHFPYFTVLFSHPLFLSFFLSLSLSFPYIAPYFAYILHNHKTQASPTLAKWLCCHEKLSMLRIMFCFFSEQHINQYIVVLGNIGNNPNHFFVQKQINIFDLN